MDLPLLSIIIPVYNVEKYLGRCLDSVLNQEYSNTEIILIDDGSTDQSGYICDQYRDNNPSVIVKHQKNAGPSIARNAGLDMAKGELIGFVDSDDRIDKLMYAVLYENMVRENAQMSCCGIKYVKDDILQGYDNANLGEYQVDNANEALMDFLDGKKISTSACDKLFRADLFTNKRFKAGIRFEDMELVLSLITLCDCVVYTGKPLYFYEQSPDSRMRGTDKTKFFDLYNVSQKKYEVYKERGLGDNPRVIENHLATCIYALSNMAEDKSLADKRIEIVNHIKAFGKPDGISRLLQFKIRLACSNLAMFDTASRLYHVKYNGAKI